jgi:para-aminobenzoate synthetase component I
MAKRQFVSFPFTDLSEIKKQVLNWSVRFNTFSFLDNQQYLSAENSYECLVAAGELSRLDTSPGHAFEQLKNFFESENDWLFGHFSFDLKSETENVLSALPDFIRFPGLFFFVPEIILTLSSDHIDIGIRGHNHREIWTAIQNSAEPEKSIPDGDVLIQNRITKTEYLRCIERLKQHILRGDCYEINFCQEFFSENADLDPLVLYRALSRASPSPFSAYYFVDQKYLLCASPERYLKRSGDLVISQPIKGTAARDLTNREHDEFLKEELALSEKDRAENVMVVDLVRNDLSRICETDSIRVSELFGVYSFPQVHQMVSTIEGRPMKNIHWTEMIAKTFPMGSMTGAPKKRVLELIEGYEKTKRGLFSGAVGYVKPNQDFDFNVVIRSLLYNQRAKYFAYFAGSGITMNSDPEKEYEECLLKVAAIESIIKKPLR